MTGKPIQEISMEARIISEEPFYMPTGNEVKLFEIAYKTKMPVCLKGPTGCGKTRFVNYMAWLLNKREGKNGKSLPLIQVAGHEDLTADDLKGRYLLDGRYMDGPATTAAKDGGILYLDEVVEARNDVTVVIHPLADKERTLAVEKLGQVFQAQENFMLVWSYNPGYQKITKDLKVSTKQRAVTIEFNYAPPEIEQRIVEREAGVDAEIAKMLVQVGGVVRGLKESHEALKEGASTRLLIYAGNFIKEGINPGQAIRVGILNSLTDDQETLAGLEEAVKSIIP